MPRKALQRHIVAPACMIALLPVAAAASSFQILEQSPAFQGTSFAGTASSAHDATTVFFNPAGMTRLEGTHLTAAGSAILAEADFSNDGSTAATGTALEAPLSGPDDTTDETGFVPNFYYVRPLSDAWSFGLGINAPFGLATSYDDDWVGRYHATDSELALLNINPTFAWRASDRVSLGIGLNYQMIDATLENEVDSFAACFNAGGGGGCAVTHGGPGNRAADSSAKIEGDDDDITLDVSLLLELSDATRIGAVFRQGGEFTLKGDADFDQSASCAGDPFCSGALTTLEGDIEADVSIPDVLTLSVTHMLNRSWTLHGDVAWTRWATIQAVEIVNSENGAPVNTLELEYDNTRRYAFGVTFHDRGPWTWRGGVAFDEAPQTDPALQTPRVPDEDRTWLSFGFNYAFSNRASLDFGYSHISVDDVEIDNTEQGNTLTGDFDASVDIVAIQGNWIF